jgi:hypothetical protein
MPVKQKYSSDFKRVYSSGALGGFDGYDFTLAFFRDNMKHPEDPSESPIVEREFVAEVILPAPALKEITRWLLENVNRIEEENGVIREPILKRAKEETTPKHVGKILAAYS